MIPKIIHYIWFGNAKKPKVVLDCIASWKKYLPGFEIKEWNELNSAYDCLYAEQAFKNKDWAFLSDYLRLKYIYEHGGIYLDTDMLVVKNFNPLLNENCFLGKESEELINGAIIGAVKNSREIKLFLDYYRNLDTYIPLPIPVIITKELAENRRANIKIYDEDFFYPYPYINSYKRNNNPREFITDNTYAIHLWYKSWKIDYHKYIQVNNYIGALNALVKLIYQNPKSYKLWRRFPGTLKKALIQYANA